MFPAYLQVQISDYEALFSMGTALRVRVHNLDKRPHDVSFKFINTLDPNSDNPNLKPVIITIQSILPGKVEKSVILAEDACSADGEIIGGWKFAGASYDGQYYSADEVPVRVWQIIHIPTLTQNFRVLMNVLSKRLDPKPEDRPEVLIRMGKGGPGCHT